MKSLLLESFRIIGLDPVQYMLRVLRDEKASQDRRDRMAVALAPYTNPRLLAIEAKITQEVTVMTEDERREQAQRLIREAFAERPLKLIEGEVVELDDAETLATEREVMGESMGSAEVSEANYLEDKEE